MTTQKQRVLDALKLHKTLTTGQMHSFGYLVNPRARVSDLRKDGHIIEVKRIKGTDSSVYKYLGFSDAATYVPDVKTTQWHPIGNSFEVCL